MSSLSALCASSHFHKTDKDYFITLAPKKLFQLVNNSKWFFTVSEVESFLNFTLKSTVDFSTCDTFKRHFAVD